MADARVDQGGGSRGPRRPWPLPRARQARRGRPPSPASSPGTMAFSAMKLVKSRLRNKSGDWTLTKLYLFYVFSSLYFAYLM